MAFKLVWTPAAHETYRQLNTAANAALRARKKSEKGKSSKAEGLFKQVTKCVHHLAANPRHPGLQTHVFETMLHPYRESEKVFEAYVQQHTAGAYRVLWCYGPGQGELTIIAIVPHP
jgi:hypothetical protein